MHNPAEFRQDALDLESARINSQEQVLQDKADGLAKVIDERTISKLAAELRPQLEELNIYDVRAAPRIARFLVTHYRIDKKEELRENAIRAFAGE